MKDIEEKYIKKILSVIVIVIIAISFAYMILPMIFWGEDYIFSIHDGLDSYGGFAQHIHDKKMLLNPNKGVDFLEADISQYYYILTYDLYNLFNCGFGVVVGQILTRIFSVVVGFFSLQYLLKTVFKSQNACEVKMIYLLSTAYAVTPISSIRAIAFSTLPMIITLFLKLKDKQSLSWLCLLSLVIPFFSAFDSVLIFAIGFWTLFTIFVCIKNKKVNLNLVIPIFLMIISALALYWNLLSISFVAGDTNRILFSDTILVDFGTVFRQYLQNGQYHSSPLHGYLILPLCVLLTAFVIFFAVSNRKNAESNYRTNISVIAFVWFLWLASAFIEAFQKSGHRVGITLIDGFQWGRVVGFMRLAWFILIAASVPIVLSKRIFANNIVEGMVGLLTALVAWYGLKMALGGNITPTLLHPGAVKKATLCVFLICSIFIFASNKYRGLALGLLVCVHIGYVAIANTPYNDTGITIQKKRVHDTSNASISFREFYSKDVFDLVKKEINYDDELVAAYGYHPAVLLFNGFKTIDRYESVHSMKMQNEFREIIAPALDLYPNYKEYYDTWGGRMYLFGELGYEPDRNKNLGEFSLYIDSSAFKKYGGKYILSRAKIGNAKDINLRLIKDFDTETSLYHIYLYEVM